MTRNEQILSEVQKRFINDKTHIVSKVNAFIDGAKWADEHPKPDMVNKQEFIEKVIEWVKNIDNAEKYLHIRTSLTDNFADALRKYLEE